MPRHDASWLDRMYNNRALVPDHARYFARWAEGSAAARQQSCAPDVVYGGGLNETLDIFAAARADAPVLVYTVAGGDESAEFLRQNALIRQAWGPKAVPVCEALPGLNHFSVLAALAQPGHRLHALARELLA